MNDIENLGPFKVDRDNPEFVRDEKFTLQADCGMREESGSMARRVAAALNFVRGFPTEALEGASLKTIYGCCPGQGDIAAIQRIVEEAEVLKEFLERHGRTKG